jgi:hypothetical protein
VAESAGCEDRGAGVDDHVTGEATRKAERGIVGTGGGESRTRGEGGRGLAVDEPTPTTGGG